MIDSAHSTRRGRGGLFFPRKAQVKAQVRFLDRGDSPP